jgi:hypothetical protein
MLSDESAIERTGIVGQELRVVVMERVYRQPHLVLGVQMNEGVHRQEYGHIYVPIEVVSIIRCFYPIVAPQVQLQQNRKLNNEEVEEEEEEEEEEEKKK